MSDEEHYRKLERMYALAPINEYFQPALRVSEGEAEVRMAVRPNLFHPAGSAHGVLYFKALDDAAFFAVNSLVHDVFVLTASLNAYLTRPVSAGEIRAVARVVHRSARYFIAEAQAFDSEGQEIARGSGTFLPGKVRLTADIGYA